MSGTKFSEQQLVAYLDEMLSIEQMATLETELRNSESLRIRVAAISRRRDVGEHSVGEIWRRARLSCPDRHQWGAYLLGTLEPAMNDYLEFHLRTVGCRVCSANLIDLKESLTVTPETEQRRRQIFQSSAGYLPKEI